MIWLLSRIFVWPVKATGYSVAAGYKTGRFFGYRRVSVFALGVGVGLLIAPVPGKALRAQLQERFLPVRPLPLPAGSPSAGPMLREPSLVDLPD